jgi:hypothetical protein
VGLKSCTSDGQVLKWNSVGSKWDCKADNDTAFSEYIFVNNVTATQDQAITSQHTIEYKNEAKYSSPGGSISHLSNNRVVINKAGLYLVKVSAYTTTAPFYDTAPRQHSLYVVVNTTLTAESLDAIRTPGGPYSAQVDAYLFLQAGDVISGQINMNNTSTVINRIHPYHTSMFIAKLAN